MNTVIWPRVLRRTVRNSAGCWIWTGCVNSKGYGLISAGTRGKSVLVHRVAAQAAGQDIDGLTVDHTCHDSDTCRVPSECPHRRCVNPAHLVAVSAIANNERRWSVMTKCAAGHPWTPRNIYHCVRRGTKECAICRSIQQANRARVA